MLHRRVIIFLVLASSFALVHQFATTTSLYWYYWWFDSVMHFSGGMLLALGVHALNTFSQVGYRPTYPVILAVLFLFTGTWELFEWYNGLWLIEGYLFDTIKDVVLGFSGGLLTHIILSKRTIQSWVQH